MKTQLATPVIGSGLSPDEAAGLERACKGDRQAFHQLVLAHQDRVFSERAAPDHDQAELPLGARALPTQAQLI